MAPGLAQSKSCLRAMLPKEHKVDEESQVCLLAGKFHGEMPSCTPSRVNA